MPAPRKTISKTIKAPAKAKTAPAKKSETQIIAQIDVGFGNHLTIRGSGAGLNWSSGENMMFCDGVWFWKTSSKEGFEFKVLLNDKIWQLGENLIAKAGQKVAFTPQF